MYFRLLDPPLSPPRFSLSPGFISINFPKAFRLLGIIMPHFGEPTEKKIDALSA